MRKKANRQRDVVEMMMFRDQDEVVFVEPSKKREQLLIKIDRRRGVQDDIYKKKGYRCS